MCIVGRMKVLLLEDDARLTGLIARGLRRDGHAVDTAGTVEDGRWFARESIYDVLVIDVMLPDGDGAALCAALRAEGDGTPVLLLTARDAVDDRFQCQNVGADDYLVKPFAFAELLARLRALVRRGAAPRPTVLSAGDLDLDPATHRVTVAGEPVPLTFREFGLLDYFLRHQDEVLSRSRILDEVWDWAFAGTPRIIDVYVRALRRHIGQGTDRPRIETVRGVGYALRPPRATELRSDSSVA